MSEDWKKNRWLFAIAPSVLVGNVLAFLAIRFYLGMHSLLALSITIPCTIFTLLITYFAAKKAKRPVRPQSKLLTFIVVGLPIVMLLLLLHSKHEWTQEVKSDAVSACEAKVHTTKISSEKVHDYCVCTVEAMAQTFPDPTKVTSATPGLKEMANRCINAKK